MIKSFEGEEASTDTLFAHITFDQIRGTFMSTDGDQVTEINASVIQFSPKTDTRRAMNIPSSRSTTLNVFSEGAATIFLEGPKHLINMSLTKNNLVPSGKIIWTVGVFTLMCLSLLPVEFVARGTTTKQALYICKDIQRFYFCRAACIDVGILVDKHKEVGPKPNKCEDQIPNRPQNPRFRATEDNIGKLKS